jgi:4-methyl-5(b-hydroxyethyl)-thiazole monophosphate biosynthesis
MQGVTPYNFNEVKSLKEEPTGEFISLGSLTGFHRGFVPRKGMVIIMVYILLADGFEEIEAVYPIDVLRRCGVEIKAVGLTKYVTGSNGITLKSDVSIDDVGIENHIDMLILPGGPGRTNLKESAPALALIRHCCESNIPIAAICGAPEILGELGFLDGKRATCYPGLEGNLGDVQYVDTPVVIDGDLITSQAAGTSMQFAFAIAEFLCGAKKAAEISGKMLCRI